jgi:hypothetical protein
MTVMLFQWPLPCDNADEGWQFTVFITTSLLIIFKTENKNIQFDVFSVMNIHTAVF